MITYRIGDATDIPDDGRGHIIVHVCNDMGLWGKGFVLAVSKRWPHVKKEYQEWHKSGVELPWDTPFELGRVQLVLARLNVWVANVIGQHDIRPAFGVPPIRYWAVEEGLARLAEDLRRPVSIHMPRIGCGLAGGSWDRIEPIVTSRLGHLPVFVYDLPEEKENP